MKILGHTSSGKPVYAAFQFHRGFDDWTVNDHNDAADLHRDAVRSDIKTNASNHKTSAALHDDEARRIQTLVEKLGLGRTAKTAKKPARHSTRKKSPAELDREIAQVLAKKSQRGRSAHATRSKAAPSWEEIAADYKRRAKAAREAGGKVKIYPDGSILVVPTAGSDEYFYQDWQADEFREGIEYKNPELLQYASFDDIVLAQAQDW